LDIEPENQTIRSNLSLLKPKDRQKEYLRFIKKNIQLEPIGKIVNTEESSSHVKEIEKVLGFYIFADINGFTEWSSNHNQNIINLMEIFIPTAYDYFGEIDKTKQDNKHIVKFLGDGFFAFQHLKDTYSDFNRDLCDLLTRVIDFMERLKEKINRPSIPENKKLTMRFGISYGKTVKLGYGRKDQVYDYIGKEVNIASRICNYQFDEISSEDGIIAMDTTDNPSIEEFLSATYPKMEVLNEIELKGIHDRRKIIIIP
jgi:class 3 adenylate cyclase